MGYKNVLSFICTVFLLIALADLPIGYYTFLRIIVTTGAIIMIISEIENGINFWIIGFGILAILFNPFFPVYFNEKSVWIPLDIIGAALFIIKLFEPKAVLNGKDKKVSS